LNGVFQRIGDQLLHVLARCAGQHGDDADPVEVDGGILGARQLQIGGHADQQHHREGAVGEHVVFQNSSQHRISRRFVVVMQSSHGGHEAFMQGRYIITAQNTRR
jgi:hypothetical protein